MLRFVFVAAVVLSLSGAVSVTRRGAELCEPTRVNSVQNETAKRAATAARLASEGTPDLL